MDYAEESVHAHQPESPIASIFPIKQENQENRHEYSHEFGSTLSEGAAIGTYKTHVRHHVSYGMNPFSRGNVMVSLAKKKN